MDNIVWFILCIYFEARGEPFKGQVAVGHVIMNRVENRDASVTEIVKAPWQFSWMNPGAERSRKVTDFDALVTCFKAALTCQAERLDGKDFFGADHYFGDYIPKPSWARDMKFVKKIGKHLFYKDK